MSSGPVSGDAPGEPGSEAPEALGPRPLVRPSDLELHLPALLEVRTADVLHVEEDVLVGILGR